MEVCQNVCLAFSKNYKKLHTYHAVNSLRKFIYKTEYKIIPFYYFLFYLGYNVS